jgi:hypothetical protein
MKNTVKAGLYAAAGTTLLAMNSVHAATDPSGAFGNARVDVSGEDRNLETAVQGYVDTFMTFLALLAVLFLLYGGFNILTAAGDEEKVKKGKTIIIQAALGLLVIFLASSIITWVLGLLTNGGS